MRFQACTIICQNYLAQARVLYHSFRKFHPDARFSVLLIDNGRETFDEPFEIFSLRDIGLPEGEEHRMPMVYQVTELATALKPWFFRHLLEKDRRELLYFDPDIEIFSPVNQLADLAAKHCLVLTPHTTNPMRRDGQVRPNETDILGSGAYNLGFLGLNAKCDRFLDWWSERLLREAMIDIANMRFCDQRWMDFAPGYFDVHVLKDETCNVAYWNADSRPIVWTGERYEINGRPLSFFHFSGFRPETPHLLSIHQGVNPRTRLSEHPDLARLCGEYAEKLNAAEYARLRKIPYGLDTTPDGLQITKAMRLLYREALINHEETGAEAPPNPFVDSAAFIQWLNEPLNPHRSPEITRYFAGIHASRRDLSARYPRLFDLHRDGFYEWLRQSGRNEVPIPNELFPVTPDRPVEKDDVEVVPGVILTGYLRAEVGTGEAGRLMTLAVEASGEKHFTYVSSEALSRQNHPWQNGSSPFAVFSAPPYDTNLLCINADQLPLFAERVGPAFFRNRYNIGLWFWEAEIFPQSMHAAFHYLHEVWVTSEFVREAVAQHSPIPVHTIPLPLNVEKPIPETSRADLNLPEGYLFLFSFDFFSVVERKNPLGLIEAFKLAFAPGEGPRLLIKTINGHRYLAELERLHHAAAGRPDIIIRDGYLTASERDALVAQCDCYVSLHRSEGFGLTIAEAMLFQKPAIATRYSGNLEFMTDSNSFLCDYRLRRIGPGFPPYPNDARWADPRISGAAELMRFVYQNPEEAQRRAKRAKQDLRDKHAPEAVAKFISGRLACLRQNPPPLLPTAAQHLERPVAVAARDAIERGADVRRTVPPLLTWILEGPRRAMKKFLRAYEKHHRQIGLSMLDAFKEVDAEWARDRAGLVRRLYAQDDEIKGLKESLNDALERLSSIEKGVNGSSPSSGQSSTPPRVVTSSPAKSEASHRPENGNGQ